MLAPVLMHYELEHPAQMIYWTYSHLCHQLAFRSWFLFGEQSHYPLASNLLDNQISYQAIFNLDHVDLFEAQNLVGNIKAGYKMALCQRDLAIYSSLLIFGLFYLFSGQRIKKISLLVWVIFGIIPFAMDGLTQLLKYLPFEEIIWIQRESTPLIRSITGGMFGFFTGWYIFPAIKEIQDR